MTSDGNEAIGEYQVQQNPITTSKARRGEEGHR